MRTFHLIRTVFTVIPVTPALYTPSRTSAQLTRVESAAVVLTNASDLESQVERDLAASLDRHIADRFPGTLTAETAGARLDTHSAEPPQAGGEIEVKVWSVLYGTWLGVAVPAAREAEHPASYGAGLLLALPATLLAGRAFTRARPVSPGQARAITWGGTWGALQGLGWAHALELVGSGDILVGRDVRTDGGASDQALLFRSMLAGSTVGLAGGVLAAWREVTPGTATSAMLGSLWGAWFGFASGALLDLDHTTNLATIAMTGNVGLVAGALTGSRWSLSRSRAHLISVGGLLGWAGGLGIVTSTQPASNDLYVGIPLVGSITGLVAGAAFTQGRREEEDVSDNAQAADSLPVAEALLNRSRRGDWTLSAPLPLPVRNPDTRDTLTWNVQLLNVQF